MVPLISFAVPALVIWCLTRLYSRRTKKLNMRGKVVLITGASSGLGRACALLFAKSGAKVVLCSRDKTSLQKVKEEIVSDKATTDLLEPVVVQLDLASPDSIACALQEVLSDVGHVDILVNNGGISYRGSVEDTSLDTHKRLMDVNYFGSVALTTGLLPSMLDRRSGVIVSISTVQGKFAVPFRSAYAASKHACQAFFDSLRSEVADRNIGVLVLSPGYINTNLSVNALNADGSQYGGKDETTLNGMSPHYVAERLLLAIETGEKEVILADVAPRLCSYFRNIMPSLFFYLMTRRAQSLKRKEKLS